MKPAIFCDYPYVVEPELFDYASRCFPDLQTKIAREPSRMSVDGNTYAAGLTNLTDHPGATIYLVRRSLSDFFVRHVERLTVSGNLAVPFWASTIDTKLVWLFDTQEPLIYKIVGFWMDHEKLLLTQKTKTLNRTNFGESKPIELIEGFRLMPTKPKRLNNEQAQALINIAQTL